MNKNNWREVLLENVENHLRKLITPAELSFFYNVLEIQISKQISQAEQRGREEAVKKIGEALQDLYHKRITDDGYINDTINFWEKLK